MGRGKPGLEDLIRERRGIRPAAGYPACPDHTEKGLLRDLLGMEKRRDRVDRKLRHESPVGFRVFFAHPRAKYFRVGKINRGQVEDTPGARTCPPFFVENGWPPIWPTNRTASCAPWGG